MTKSLRIGIAAFMHESNTFIVAPTSLADFEIHREQEMIRHYESTFHEVGGFIEGAAEYNFELVPFLAANATPSGALTQEAYETILQQLLAHITDALPSLDGLLLALHGAMVAEHIPQADGETVKRVREAVGETFPLVVTHDYHGNIPASLVDDVTALIIYKTCPHIDQRERGVQAAGLVSRTARGEIEPVCALAKPELLFNIVFHNTSSPPMQPLIYAAVKMEDDPSILATSIAAGYQYADVPAMGPSVVVVADGDKALAQKEADRLAAMMWDVRDELIPQIPRADRAVRMAIESKEKPVALFELGDNIGGGSAGDATILLQELLIQRAEGWVVALYDPAAVSACVAAGVGQEIALQVGGKTDTQHGPPVSISGRVRALHEGTYEETERRHGGARFLNQGLSALVATQSGLLILNSRRTTPFSIHQLTSLGVRPERQKILVAKGAVAPRAAYEPVCPVIIEVDTAGATAINRPREAYRRARSSLYEWRI